MKWIEGFEMVEYRFSPDLLRSAIRGLSRKVMESIEKSGSYTFEFEGVMVAPVYAVHDGMKSLDFSRDDLSEVHFFIYRSGFLWKVWLFSDGRVVVKPRIRKDFVEHLLGEFSKVV